MSNDSLKARVVSGLRWTAITRGLSQLVTWSVTLLVVRLLTPADYGLVAMATLVSSYLVLLGEFGLSVALVQRRQLDLQTLQSVFGALLIGGLALFVLMVLLGPLISMYFSEPRLTALIFVVALQFLLIPFTVISQAQLTTDMRFAALGFCGLASASIGAFSTLALAYAGFGAYALATGIVVQLLTRAVILNIQAPFLHRPKLRFRLIRELATFSKHVMMGRTIWYWSAELDIVITGYLFGATSVGMYSIAKQIAVLLSERYAEIMNTVATSAYSSIQEDLLRVLELHVKSIQHTAMVSFPMFWGLGVVAPDLIAMLFGNKWIGAVPLIQLLCFSMPLKTIGTLTPTMLTAIGHPEVAFRCVAWTAGLVSCALLFGAQWGPTGVAAGFAIGFPIAYGVVNRLVSVALEARTQRLLVPLVIPVVSSTLMVFATELARVSTLSLGSRAISFGITVAVGVVVYMGVIWLIARKELEELLQLSKRILGR